VLVLLQVIWQSEPQLTLQLGPLEQAYVQWSVHVASQSLPKLLQVGAHGEAVPQSRAQTPPPWQTQEAPVQTGPPDEHARATTTSAASHTDLPGRTRAHRAMHRRYPQR
jgi:hypothetical protein